MHDRADLGGGQQRLDRVPVGGVAGRADHVGAQRGQRLHQFGAGAPTAGQHQVGDAVADDQVAGDLAAQRPGRAGDQHRAAELDRPFAAGGDPGQPRREDLPVPQGHLGFARRHRGGQRRRVEGVGQHDPARVLRLGRADQAPDGRERQVGDGLVRDRGHRARGHQDQGRLGVPGVGQPRLEQGQGALGGDARAEGHVVLDDLGQVAVVEAAVRHHDRRHRRGRLVEGEQVGVAVDEDVRAEVEVGLAQDGPAHRPGDAGGGHRDPVDLEQRLVPGGPGDGELLARDGPGDQRGDGGDRGRPPPTRGRRSCRCRRGEPDPEPGGARGVDGDAGPGEREAVLVLARAEEGGVQGGVQQGRVQGEPGGLGRVGQGDLGVEDLAVPPGRLEPLEERAVGEPRFGEPVVEVLHVGLGRARRRPGRQALPRHAQRAEQAVGVAGPRLVVGVEPRVQGDGAPSAPVGRADHELELHRHVLRQHERRFEGQLVDDGAAGLLAGVQGQFDEGRPGQQHGVHDGVVGQPRVGGRRQTAGEQHALRCRPAARPRRAAGARRCRARRR